MKQILLRPKWMEPPFKNKVFEPISHFRACGILGHYWRLALKECLAERGYDLKTIDLGDPIDAEKILFVSMHTDKHFDYCIRHFLNERMVLFELEFPIEVGGEGNYPTDEYRNFFGKVLTWNEALVDNKRVFKVNRPNNWYRGELPNTPFEERKLCVMIATNKYSDSPYELYSERRKAIFMFQKLCPNGFDLYGSHWDRSAVRYASKHVPVKFNPKGKLRLVEKKLGVEKAIKKLMREPAYPSFVGWTSDKYQTMNKYRFAFCYENVKNLRGAVSAKIFDCFQSGCVPIYLGAPNIEDYVPRGTFVNKRKFTYLELLEYLLSVEESEHEEFLHNAQQFLRGHGKKHFEKDWAEDFCEVLLNG